MRVAVADECHHGWALDGIPPCEQCHRIRYAIFHQINQERRRQIAKFGDQASKPTEIWIGILAEEFGEAVKVAMQNRDDQYSYEKSTLADLREELIEVAAVSVAWIEKIDRDA